jgi:hypothetical protein
VFAKMTRDMDIRWCARRTARHGGDQSSAAVRRALMSGPVHAELLRFAVCAGLLLACAVQATMAIPLGAQSVMLAADGQAGQGLTRPRGINECFVIAPLHLVRGAGQVSAVVEAGVRAELQLRQDYEGADLAVLEHAPGRTIPCSRWNVPANLSEILIEDPARVTLRQREDDGSVSFTPVTIQRVESGFVIIAPVDPRGLSSGMSGSQLMVDGRFAGMLLTVDAPNGTGRVLRSDAIERLTSGFFTAPRNQDPDFSTAPLGVPSSEPNLWLRTNQSVILGDRHTAFGVVEYNRRQNSLYIQLNGQPTYIVAGARMPFDDSRGECYLIYLRTDDPSPPQDSRVRHGFAVVCGPRQGGAVRRN